MNFMNGLYRKKMYNVTSPFKQASEFLISFSNHQSIQIWLKSIRGPIDVYLCPEASQMKELSPVKQAPPPPLPSRPSAAPHGLGSWPQVPTQPPPAQPRPPQLSAPLGLEQPPRSTLPEFNLRADDSIPDDFEDVPLISLCPSFTDEDYLLGLDETEGIADLFEDYDFF